MKIVFLISFLFVAVIGYPQSYSNLQFEHINNNDGLISDVVYSTCQDNNGYIWFGTAEGIVRYDGYEFRSFKRHPYLGKLYGTGINKIVAGKDGSLYVCSNRGFYAFSSEFKPILSFASKVIRDFQVNNVLVASDSTIYLTSGRGFYIVDPRKKKVITIKQSKNSSMASSTTRQLVEDKKGQIWVGNWEGGLLRLNPDHKSFTAFKLAKNRSPKNNGNIVNALYIDSHGYLWVGTWDNGIFVVDINDESEVRVVKHFIHHPEKINTIPGNMIFDFQEDQYNAMWIGTPYGVAVIRYPMTWHPKITRFEYSENPNKISSDVISNIFLDSSGLMWIATKGGGVDKVHIERNKFTHIKIPELDPQKRTQSTFSFINGGKQQLYIGVLSLGFVAFDLKTESFHRYTDLSDFKSIDDSLDLNTVKAFAWDSDSLLWIGTRYRGIIIFNPRTKKFKYLTNPTLDGSITWREIYVLYPDNDGSMWAGTDAGLFQIGAGSNDHYHLTRVNLEDERSQDHNKNLNIVGITKAESGSFYIATETRGLFKMRMDKGKFEIKSLISDTTSIKFITLFKDREGHIWLGTKGNGIMQLTDQKKLVSPISEGEISGDVIYGINQDSKGSIWFTSNRGLTKLWYEQDTPKTERFTSRDGLQGNIFIPRSFYKDASGMFYIGGYNGFNVFNPLKISGNFYIPPIVITDLYVSGAPYPYVQGTTSHIDLKYNENDFSVAFASLSYLMPEANQYAYMIKGIDKQWKYVTSEMRSATYSNLSPGDYSLMIKGSNSQGVWNPKPLILQFTVEPAPYKTWWAFTGYFILVIAIIWAIFWQRLRAEKIKQHLQLASIEKSKSEKLNQYKLSFFTNISHELLTPLSIISTAIDIMSKQKKYSEGNVELLQRNVNDLIRLIRRLLSFRKVETGNMQVKLVNDDISQFVNQCVRDFQLLAQRRAIRYELFIEPGIKGLIDREKIEIILHNLLSNAFRYTTNGNVALFLEWHKEPSHIQISVKDSGRGINKEALPHIFDRFYRDTDSAEQNQAGVGIGLNLTKSLIDMLNGEISIESEEGKGTTFTIILPVKEEFVSKGSVLAYNEKPDFIVEAEKESQREEKSSDQPIVENKRYTLLIADDNDDYRKVLCEALHDQFNLLEARDGEEALNLIFTKNVDLIISDIMMPKLSGKALCQKLKSDINVSHIPVILLTAKTGDDNKLAGYQSGADSYIEKPANTNLLIVRTKTLLRQREQLKKHFKSNFSLQQENVAITSIDEEFIIRAKEIVEKYLSDPEFSVKMLSSELNSSNSMVYRKLKSLVGLSPNEFIRNIRLRKAAMMLENIEYRISEVAFNCGFNDVSYFGGCFKNMYGVTPSAYQSGERNKLQSKINN